MALTFARLMKPGNRELVYHATATISRSCSTTGIHSRNRTILRHLFLSRASRIDLTDREPGGVETSAHVVS